MKYVDVILPLPLEGVFTYSVPSSLQPYISERLRVKVPLGRSKTYIGVVSKVHDSKPDFECRDITEIIDRKPILLPEQLRLWQWIADYYMSPLGDVYKAAFPAGMKAEDGYKPRTETYVTLQQKFRNEEGLHRAIDMLKRAPTQSKVFMAYLELSHYDTLEGETPREPIAEVSRDELINVSRQPTASLRALVTRGIIMTYERQVSRIGNDMDDDAATNLIDKDRKSGLSDAQQVAFDDINRQFLTKNIVLLHGVTSSGKTEIYIEMIWKAISEGKQVMYLLPEIALTVQIMQRLQRVFGSRLGIYHSKYSDEERVELWQRQLSDHPFDVILGARSAVFLPFQRLGLVIVDEEHETSFKQQDPAPRYHARSVAMVLAQMTNAKTLLGTATPSIETYFNARAGKYGLVTLSTRYKDIALPQIEIIDTKDLQRRKMMKGAFSPQLLAAVGDALSKKKQAIIFINRRGFVPMIECRTCGWVPKCENCDVSLTYHRTTNTLSCHYCGYTYKVPSVCPSCDESDLRGRGYGTEKIEDTIQRHFPTARIARMDLDTTRTRAAYERIIGEFASGRSNLLIGTQMVTKGLDFDNVAVVGIISADSMINAPDFRAYEHAYMMLSQVSGRAGRKGEQGRVILQTRQPELPLLENVVNNDYLSFYKDTLNERQIFHYPPFYRITYVYLKHRNANLVDSAAFFVGSLLRKWFGERILGPDKPPVAVVKQLHIRKIVIKIENGLPLQTVRQYLRSAQSQMLAEKRYNTVQFYFDVDPC